MRVGEAQGSRMVRAEPAGRHCLRGGCRDFPPSNPPRSKSMPRPHVNLRQGALLDNDNG